MWRVVALTALALLGSGALIWLAVVFGFKTAEDATKRDGLAGLKGSILLKESNKLFDSMLDPDIFDDTVTFLSNKDRAAIEAWQTSYYKYKGKSK